MAMGASLDALLEDCRALVDDPEFPAVHRWLDAHPAGRVLGHFQVYFPEEIAHAAGMLPVKILGAGGNVQIRKADARIAAFVCSILRSSLELALTGRLDFLSVFAVPPICDAARNACGVWARNLPSLGCQMLYLPQNAASPHAAEYLTAEYRRIARILEEVAGRPVTAEALRASTAVFNENRALLRAVYRVKRDAPWLLSAVEVYTLVRAGGLMPREEHNALLRQVLQFAPGRPHKRQDKIRVVFEGGYCEQPPIDMLAVIQDACYVVDDDLLIGLRWLTGDVPMRGDPVANLARAYLDDSTYSPVQHDPRKPKPEMLLRRVRGGAADAAIVAAPKMCEPGLEEQVNYVRALEAAGVPYLVLEFEEKMTVFEQMRMEIETFAESLLLEFV